MISHPHKTVFVHIPKCGGQSIETAFLEDLGRTWKERDFLLLRANDKPALGPPRLAHLRAVDYVSKHYLSAALFESYYSFGITRCPYSRVLSLHSYLDYRWGLNRFVEKWLPRQFADKGPDRDRKRARSGKFWFVRPQVDYLYDGEGKCLVDDVFPLETLAEHYAEIQKKSGLKTLPGHANKTRRKKASIAHLSPKNIETIRRLYGADFDKLGHDETCPCAIT